MTGLPGERLRDKIAAVICPGDYCESHSECLRDADFVMPLVEDYVRERAAELLALARGVAALAEELETTASSRRVLALDAEAAGASEESVFLRDRADDEQAQADRLRALLAVAAPDEETR